MKEESTIIIYIKFKKAFSCVRFKSETQNDYFLL